MMGVEDNDRDGPNIRPASLEKQAAAEPNSGEEATKKGLRPKRTATFRDYMVRMSSTNAVFL